MNNEKFSLFNVGQKATGKTTFCKEHIGSMPDTERILVLDFNYEYHQVPILCPYISRDIDYLTNPLKTGKRRLVPGDDEKDVEECIETISRQFKHGTLIIEQPFHESKKYIEMIELLIASNRSKNLNIIINFQSLNRALFPRFFLNVNYINLFKCCETIDRTTSLHPDVSDYYYVFKDAEKSLKRYRNVFVNMDEMTTICGDYKGIGNITE